MLHFIFILSQGVVTNFEIFRMREKQVPVDVVEMKGKNACVCVYTLAVCNSFPQT